MQPYTYHLPEELIAHQAAEPRESARLMVWPEGTNRAGEPNPTTYARLPELLEPGSLLVVNESKVLPARIFGTRPARAPATEPVKVELLLHRPLDSTLQAWDALAKPGKRLREGDTITLEGGATAEVTGWSGNGFVQLELSLKGDELEPYLQTHGHTPLPPYIHAEDTPATRARYQTTYARTPGSVAAPTAGLHFSQQLIHNLKQAGVNLATVTLHVGAGTFQNPTPEQLASGQLHSEWCHLPPETAAAINATKAAGKPVIAVGTTTLRTLESAALAQSGPLQPFTGETSIFIRPGFQFKVADKLITNFHLPGSSLLMLVAAFIGEDALHQLYQRAITERMRFYSFGDGCLLSKA